MQTLQDYQLKTLALELLLHPTMTAPKLKHADKITLSKIMRDLASLAKLNSKDLKEFLKTNPGYSSAINSLKYDCKPNTYFLLKNQSPKSPVWLTQARPSSECVGMKLRVEFTVEQIEKSAMKPLILLCCQMKDGSKWRVYFGLEQWAQLRRQVAEHLTILHGIQLRIMS